MIWLLLSATLLLPLGDVVDMRLAIPTNQNEIFTEYANGNFSQSLFFHAPTRTLYANVRNSNFQNLDLNFRVTPDAAYIGGLTTDLRELVGILLGDGSYLDEYFRRISDYLSGGIRYSEEDLPRHPAFVVLNKRTDCVGYALLVKVLLEAAGVRCSEVRGFYLKETPHADKLAPTPHRWLEIELPNQHKFFFDPQYQTFSAYYLITRQDIDFKRIKRFNVTVIERSKKITN